MKELEDVIKTYEICTDPTPDDNPCKFCPYKDEERGCYLCKIDTLYYLKEYHKLLSEVENLEKRYCEIKNQLLELKDAIWRNEILPLAQLQFKQAFVEATQNISNKKKEK